MKYRNMIGCCIKGYILGSLLYHLLYGNSTCCYIRYIKIKIAVLVMSSYLLVGLQALVELQLQIVRHQKWTVIVVELPNAPEVVRCRPLGLLKATFTACYWPAGTIGVSARG